MDKHNRGPQDEARLEIRCKETHDLMASRAGQFDYQETLIRIKRFIKTQRKQDQYSFSIGGQRCGYFVFPIIIDMILRFGTSLSPLREWTDDELKWFIDKIICFPDMLELPTGESDRNRYVPEFYIRSAFHQLRSQEMTRSLIPRALHIYRTVPESDETRHSRFLLARDEVLKQQYRLNIDDLLYATLSLAAVANSGDRFKDNISTDFKKLEPYILSDVWPIMRAHLTLTIDEYRERSSQRDASSYRHALTKELEIVSHPIIRIDDHCIAPDPHLLVDVVTKKLHESFYQYYEENDRLQEYSSAYGEVFKDYVGLLLKDAFGPNCVHDLDKYGILQGAKKADWIVVIGDCAVIFECKACRYPRQLKMDGSLQTLSSFADNRLDEGVEQLIETERTISDLSAAIPQLESATNRQKVIVLEENFEHANMLIHFIPNNETVRQIDEHNVQIMSLLEIELLVMTNIRKQFRKAFSDKLQPEHRHSSFDSYWRHLSGFDFESENMIGHTLRRFREIDLD